MDHGVPVVLEQKTTILRKCLYLLASLKDPSGLSVTYETKRSSEEENPIHRQNTMLNVDKIRSFRPPYAWMKTFGYCWPTSFKVLGVLFLREVFSTFLPSTKACWTHKLRHFGVDQQYPPVKSTHAGQSHSGAKSCTETQSTNQRRVCDRSGSFSTIRRQDRVATAIGGTLTVTTLAYSE
jgi:hypothetical protein